MTGALRPTRQVGDLVDATRGALDFDDVSKAAVQHARTVAGEVFDGNFGRWLADAVAMRDVA